MIFDNEIVRKKIITGIISIIISAVLMIVYRLINRKIIRNKLNKQKGNPDYSLQFPFNISGEKYQNPIFGILFYIFSLCFFAWLIYEFIIHKHFNPVIVIGFLSLIIIYSVVDSLKRYFIYRQLVVDHCELYDVFVFDKMCVTITKMGKSEVIYYNEIQKVVFNLDVFVLKKDNRTIRIPVETKKIYEYSLLAKYIIGHQFK